MDFISADLLAPEPEAPPENRGPRSPLESWSRNLQFLLALVATPTRCRSRCEEAIANFDQPPAGLSTSQSCRMESGRSFDYPTAIDRKFIQPPAPEREGSADEQQQGQNDQAHSETVGIGVAMRKSPSIVISGHWPVTGLKGPNT